MENVNFIYKLIPFSYIKNLLEIVVKIKIKKCWHYQVCFPLFPVRGGSQETERG